MLRANETFTTQGAAQAARILRGRLGRGIEAIVHAAGVLQDGLILPNLQKALDSSRSARVGDGRLTLKKRPVSCKTDTLGCQKDLSKANYLGPNLFSGHPGELERWNAIATCCGRFTCICRETEPRSPDSSPANIRLPAGAGHVEHRLWLQGLACGK